MDRLHKFVDGGFVELLVASIIMDVKIPCGGTGGVVGSGEERNRNFIKAMTTSELTVR